MKEAGQGSKWQWLEAELQSLQQRNLYRTFKVLDGAQSAHVSWQGREMLLLASNAYLDLCNDPEVKSFAAQVVLSHGVGSGGSRLTTGTCELHVLLEETLARFKGREAAIVFNSGFAANSGVIPALCASAEDVIFSDELNHASIIDGCRQSPAQTIIYRHNDMRDLAQKIQAARFSGHGLIVSDAVFSMDGDIVNLPDLLRVAEQANLLTMLDEAHATGVIGQTGHGVEEHFGLPGQVDILMGTMSKALGAEGGYVCGSQQLVDYLRNKTRSYIFSTSLGPATMAAALRALQIIEAEPQRVTHLQANVRWFCRCLQEHGLGDRVPEGAATAIIPIYIGDEAQAVQVSERLLAAGYFIPAIRYPTVKKGQAILRAALMSSHTKAELAQAAQAIAEAINSDNLVHQINETDR